MGDFLGQLDLEGELVHAPEDLPAVELRELVLDVNEGLGEASRVAERGLLREVRTAETSQIERAVDSLEVLLEEDAQLALKSGAELMRCLHVIELDHHATISELLELRSENSVGLLDSAAELQIEHHAW